MKHSFKRPAWLGIAAGSALALGVLASSNGGNQALAQIAAAPAANAAAKPNIVFILADDLGYKDLGCYGSTFYDTPNLDKLAKQGVLFTDAYAACPVCSPTRASLLSGQYPQRTGVVEWIGAAQPNRWKRNTKLLPAPYTTELPLETVTMAEMLKGQGYATGFFGKWHLGSEGFWPEDQGFDVNKGGTSSGSPPRGGGRYFSPYNNPRLTDGPKGEHLPDRLATEVNTFMEANRDKPFLAYFSFYEVHGPHMTTPELQAKYEKRAQERGLKAEWEREEEADIYVRQNQTNPVFGGMVEAMDAAAGKVMDKLKELGLEENTIVVFTSDNGGVATAEGWPTSIKPLRGGKGWLYEGGIREPLLVRWPGVATAGTVSKFPVNSPDFYTTFMNAASAQAPANQPLDGIDLKPVLQGQPVAPRALFWEYPRYSNQGGAPGSVVRLGDWKLIHWFEGDKIELFDLSKDVGEQNDLAAQNSERVKAMTALLNNWRKEVGAQSPTLNPNYDAAKDNARFTGVPREVRGTDNPGKNKRGKQKDGEQDEE